MTPIAAQGGRSRLREAAKDAVFFCHAHLVRPIPRRVLALRGRQRLVVLVYHRVNDQLHDPMTVGISQFGKQMAWIRDHYPVVGAEDLVRSDYPKDAMRPAIAVTFDDGYRDNYENAVPSLVRHRIPATFFVSTGFMDTTRGFDHDIERLGFPVPTLTWNQLRHMRDLGFTIGSHTVNHVNLARVPLEIARAELLESKAALERELGVTKPYIAYPFGQRADITPDVRALIQELGYQACFSAWGGRNAVGIDVFDIKRVPIDHKFSASAFKSRLEGWT